MGGTVELPAWLDTPPPHTPTLPFKLGAGGSFLRRAMLLAQRVAGWFRAPRGSMLMAGAKLCVFNLILLFPLCQRAGGETQPTAAAFSAAPPAPAALLVYGSMYQIDLCVETMLA